RNHGSFRGAPCPDPISVCIVRVASPGIKFIVEKSSLIFLLCRFGFAPHSALQARQRPAPADPGRAGTGTPVHRLYGGAREAADHFAQPARAAILPQTKRPAMTFAAIVLLFVR